MNFASGIKNEKKELTLFPNKDIDMHYYIYI